MSTRRLAILLVSLQATSLAPLNAAGQSQQLRKYKTMTPVMDMRKPPPANTSPETPVEVEHGYKIMVQQQLQLNWQPQRLDSRVELGFKVMPDGTLRDLTFLKKSPDKKSNVAAFAAAQHAAPFLPVPEGKMADLVVIFSVSGAGTVQDFKADPYIPFSYNEELPLANRMKQAGQNGIRLTKSRENMKN